MLLDRTVSEMLFRLANQSAVFDWLAVFFATIFPYFLSLGFLIAVFRFTKNWRRRSYLGGFTSVALLISYGIISRIFHYTYPRLRPFDEIGFTPLFAPHGATAFPSNHATILFTLAFTLWFFSKAKNSWLLEGLEKSGTLRASQFHIWFFLGAILVTLARVFSGVHWFLDVISGMLIALFAVIITNRILPVTR